MQTVLINIIQDGINRDFNSVLKRRTYNIFHEDNKLADKIVKMIVWMIRDRRIDLLLEDSIQID